MTLAALFSFFPNWSVSLYLLIGLTLLTPLIVWAAVDYGKFSKEEEFKLWRTGEAERKEKLEQKEKRLDEEWSVVAQEQKRAKETSERLLNQLIGGKPYEDPYMNDDDTDDYLDYETGNYWMPTKRYDRGRTDD